MPLFKKKPPSENPEALRDISKDVTEPDFIPYACHWDPHTIVTRNGELLQTIRIPGLSRESPGEGEGSDLRSVIREVILSSIDSTEYAIWIHTLRRKRNLATGGQFKRDFAGYLDRFWNDRNDWEHQFANEVYLTVVHEGQAAKLFDIQGFARGIVPSIDNRYRERFLEEALGKLSAVMEKMLPPLTGYGAKRLGVVQHGDVYYSEVCAFLSKLVTTLDQDFPVTDSDLAYALADCDVTFGHNAMEIRSRSTGKRRYGGLLTLKEYREVSTELLDQLLQIPAEFTLSQCFHFANSGPVLKAFEYQKELFSVSKAAPLAEKVGLVDIFASHKGRLTDFGQHQLSMFLPADSVKAMENALAKASGALSALGMTSMREDVSLEEGYWAQCPANFEFIRRMRPVNTARIGGFANLNNSPEGRRDGNHWGSAVTTLWTASHIPYCFNFHAQDNGHTTIIGPPATGKTVLMNFLLAEARKFDNKLFFFDTGRSSEIFLRSLGGAYYNPYPAADTRPYAQLSLNPFQLEDTPANREFLRHWLVSLARAGADKALPAACDKAIAAVMQRPRAQRELRLCIEALRAENAELAELFAPWIGQGEHAALFGSAADSLVFSDRIVGFEMQDVVQHKATLVPVLSYLLHRITLALDGTPAILVLDEAWTLLDDPLFTARIGEWLDMLRAKNTMVIFATEHVAEAGKSSMNKTLMAKIATQIYLPDEDVDALCADAFGLTEGDLSYLGVMNTEDRHFLLKCGEDALVMELGLAGMSDIIAVLSATPRHLGIMERVIGAQSLQPSQWMPKFLELI